VGKLSVSGEWAGDLNLSLWAGLSRESTLRIVARGMEPLILGASMYCSLGHGALDARDTTIYLYIQCMYAYNFTLGKGSSIL
jgi:hypothetical protein